MNVEPRSQPRCYLVHGRAGNVGMQAAALGINKSEKVEGANWRNGENEVDRAFTNGRSKRCPVLRTNNRCLGRCLSTWQPCTPCGSRCGSPSFDHVKKHLSKDGSPNTLRSPARSIGSNNKLHPQTTLFRLGFHSRPATRKRNKKPGALCCGTHLLRMARSFGLLPPPCVHSERRSRECW